MLNYQARCNKTVKNIRNTRAIFENKIMSKNVYQHHVICKEAPCIRYKVHAGFYQSSNLKGNMEEPAKLV